MSLFSFPDNETHEPEQPRSVYGKVFSVATQMLHSLRADEEDPQQQQSSRGNSPQLSDTHAREGAEEHQSSASTLSEPQTSRPSFFRTSTMPSATVGVSEEQAVPLLPTSLIPRAVTRAPEPSHGRATFSLPARDGESLMSVSSSASRAYLASQYNRGRSRAVPGRLSREFWMKDESAVSCFGCNRQFTTFRRKHHCRVCGQIFCSTCTRLIDGERFGAPGRRVRCCTACEDALETHSSSEDEDVSFNVSFNQFATPDYDSDWPDSLPSADESEHSSYSRVASPGAPGKDELHFARSFLGASHHHTGKHSRPRSYSQQKRDEDSHVRRKRSSSTGTLLGTPTNSPAFAAPALVTLSSSPISAPLLGTPTNTVAANSVPPPHGPTPPAMVAPSIDDYPQSTARFPHSATVELNSASLTYLSLFLDQLLRDSELPVEEWNHRLTPPLLQAAAGLHLELNDHISPREWVKIKRIPGGNPDDIECICGSAFTHVLTRTSMPTRSRMPRILLIAFPIEYARHDRYMSLEPVVAQEKEYLRKLVARIKGLQPTLLLTCSHVCGQALDMLEASGVSVAQNMRQSALFHLSRIVKADILPSIDRLSAAPRLGTCELFEVRSYRYENVVKTFMFFFVKASDPGRCVLVRGDPTIGSIVKVVMEVMAEICYNLKAETSLMRDQFVLIPPLTNPPAQILSSSPFVDYGTPYLQQQAHKLEDEVVELGHKLDNLEGADHYILSAQLEVTRRKWIDTTNQWENVERSNPYMFNPSSHQNLVVLHSLHCSKTQTPCQGPDQLLIEFYLDTDQTLGQAVENTILQVNDPCPDNCEYNLEGHYKMYVNGNGCVTIHTEKSPCKLPGLQDSILMWSYCTKCDQQMPVLPMSSTTWKYSMGKYLELSFYGEPLKMRASSCEHNIYRDHIRYFGWHDYALKIEYSQVDMNEISRPPKVLLWDPSAEIHLKQRVYLQLLAKLERFWDSVLDCLSKVTVEGLEEDTMQQSHRRLEKLKLQAAADRDESINMLHRLNKESRPYDYLALNGVLELYQQLVDNYLAEFAEFDGQFFPTERDIRRVTAQHIHGLLGEDPEKAKSTRQGSVSSERSTLKQNEKIPASLTESDGHSYAEHVASNEELAAGSSSDVTVPSNYVPKSETRASDVDRTSPEAIPTSDTSAIDVTPVIASTFNSTPTKLQPRKQSLSSESTPRTPQTVISENDVSQRSPSIRVKSKYGNNINVSMPGLVPPNIREGTGRVSILARHFEELSRDFERERQREKQRLKDRQKSMALKQAQPVAEVFEDVSEAIEDWPQHSRSSSKSALTVDNPKVPPVPDSPNDEQELDDESNRLSRQTISRANEHPAESAMLYIAQTLPQSLTSTHAADVNNSDEVSELATSSDKRELDDEDMKKAEPIRLSLVRALTNFWAERSSTRWNGIEYVLGSGEHLFSNSRVVLRESEPSSLIAFCLSLPDYVERVAEFYSDTPGISSDQASDADEDVSLERAMLRQTGTHMRYHFGQNNVRVSCKIFFSEQFDALRRKCKCSDRFVQSLSRCSTWDSAGGKSGSAFLKTLDDRLILKELSHAEFDSFVQFAPSYFEYMAQALFHDLPTVLAKLFGVYQITIRSTQSSQQIKMYVLVMENLFYGAKFNKFFDLKGSMRNRKVTETGKANEVLLDENMVEYIYDKPVFVREHSKHMLRSSLYNDTLFLTKMNVMDYSLVIGLDEENRTIVAGIIDYIRTYTWDKKIENWVKGKASTGVKEPTVVSPKQYKVRFRESMERYFVMVPDCWSQPIT